jgi:ATP-dependent DNA ligase
MLPRISPAPLTSVKEPIGHPNWIYELKHDGFRGILYVDRDHAWLVSRKGKKFNQFDPLLKQVLRCLKGHRAILTGVRAGPGRNHMQAQDQPSPYPFTWLKVKNPTTRRRSDAGKWFDRLLQHR